MSRQKENVGGSPISPFSRVTSNQAILEEVVRLTEEISQLEIPYASSVTLLSDVSPADLFGIPMHIPKEIIHMILRTLSIPDLISCTSSNRGWYTFLSVSSKEMWEDLCNTKFGAYHKIPQWSWKRTFYELCLERTKGKRRKAISDQADSAWMLRRVKCGKRRLPDRLKAVSHPSSIPSTFEASSAWPLHPNTSDELISSLQVDLCASAANLLILYSHGKQYNSSYNEDALEHAKKAIIMYQRFLALKAENPEELLVPTLDIEIAWTSHLIRPNLYATDMSKLYGRIITHSLVAREGEMSVFKKALEQTKALWDAKYPDCPYPAVDVELLPKPFPRFEPPPRRATKRTSGLVTFSSATPALMYTATVGGPLSLEDALEVSLSPKHLVDDMDWLPHWLRYMGPYGRKCSTYYMEKSGPKAYERWMYFCAIHPDEAMVHPTAAIDLFWHAHMCHPVEYHEDCLRLAGHVLDHNPSPEFELENFHSGDDMWAREFGVGIEHEHMLLAHGERRAPKQQTWAPSECNFREWDAWSGKRGSSSRGR